MCRRTNDESRDILLVTLPTFKVVHPKRQQGSAKKILLHTNFESLSPCLHHLYYVYGIIVLPTTSPAYV